MSILWLFMAKSATNNKQESLTMLDYYLTGCLSILSSRIVLFPQREHMTQSEFEKLITIIKGYK